MTKFLRHGVSAAAIAAVMAPAAAMAYTHEPFFTNPVELSQANAMDIIAMRINLARQFEAPLHEELVEALEGNRTGPLPRFEASLRAVNPEHADNLREALEELAEAAEDGEDIGALADAAFAQLNAAYGALFTTELLNSPAFIGGAMLQLLLGEGGVAEGYEEAAEEGEPWEYPNGWIALERVKSYWSAVGNLGTPEQQEDGEATIALMQSYYPTHLPPESVAGWNPEEVEAPAQRMAGIVEAVTDAALYPGRDPVRLAGLVGELAATACAAIAADDAAGIEAIFPAYDLYEGEMAGLGAMASLFAPEDHEVVEESFETIFAALGFAAGDDDDDDDDDDHGDDAAHDDDDDAAADADDDHDDDGDDDADEADAAEACEALPGALANIRTALGG